MTKLIDVSFLPEPDLNKAEEGWGYLNVKSKEVLESFEKIQDIVNPKVVIEIGMFAGRSTLIMLEHFESLQKLTSYDPNPISLKAANEIQSRYPKFSFYNGPIWGNEDVHKDVDLIFIDGDHTPRSVLKDIKSCSIIRPKYVLFDNVEKSGVSAVIDRLRLYEERYNPTFFFYVDTHKGIVKPGILMLVNITDSSWTGLRERTASFNV